MTAAEMKHSTRDVFCIGKWRELWGGSRHGVDVFEGGIQTGGILCGKVSGSGFRPAIIGRPNRCSVKLREISVGGRLSHNEFVRKACNFF